MGPTFLGAPYLSDELFDLFAFCNSENPIPPTSVAIFGLDLAITKVSWHRGTDRGSTSAGRERTPPWDKPRGHQLGVGIVCRNRSSFFRGVVFSRLSASTRCPFIGCRNCDSRNRTFVLRFSSTKDDGAVGMGSCNWRCLWLDTVGVRFDNCQRVDAYCL